MSDIIGPTPERVASLETRREGLATRIVPPIDTLRKRGKLNDEQHAMLSWYAEQKNISERSILQDSLGRMIKPRRGHGGGPSPTILSALETVARIERELGSLRPVAEAICFNEMTITEWLDGKGKCRIRCQATPRGKICKPYARQKDVDIAVAELKYAASRIKSAAM